MSIISPSIFVGEINIPNTDQQSVSENVQLFINEYESEYLQKLMGKDVYADYLINTADYTDILASAEMQIARYVYYWWMDDKNTYNAGTQTVKSKNDNSSSASPYPKMVKAWNKMVKASLDIRKELYKPENGYVIYLDRLPECICNLPFETRHCTRSEDIFNYKNSLGI